MGRARDLASRRPLDADHPKVLQWSYPVRRAEAFVDLDSPQFGLVPNCKVGKAKFFCAPAQKTVLSAVDKATKLPITPLPVTGPNVVMAERIESAPVECVSDGHACVATVLPT